MFNNCLCTEVVFMNMASAFTYTDNEHGKLLFIMQGRMSWGAGRSELLCRHPSFLHLLDAVPEGLGGLRGGYGWVIKIVRGYPPIPCQP